MTISDGTYALTQAEMEAEANIGSILGYTLQGGAGVEADSRPASHSVQAGRPA